MGLCLFYSKYVPKVAKFPPDYIYEPWKAPLSTQKAAGCIIGKDYPARIVDHETIVKVNLQRMNQAYSKNKTDDGNLPNSSKRSLSEMEKSDDYSDETLTEGSNIRNSKDSRPPSKKHSSSSTKQLSIKESFLKSKK